MEVMVSQEAVGSHAKADAVAHTKGTVERMTRGTTPDYVITVEDMESLGNSTVYVTLRQGDVVVTKETDDLSIEGNQINVSLTQEETLAFTEGYAQMQVRGVTNGDAWASPIVDVPVKPVLLEEIIV